ncbi:MAG: DUF3501 family protein [Pseudomonadota bacterium]|nr:DUF3501 family protein [Pseudomonadota bacterium]MEC7106600.1 DUF3501 family protein [Pseudomonadota bacterium]MEC7139163.1 DUF3501 family protein [Pseudomonadota bacterium]MEC7250608.1 DUF3501 family protein [Pseudomonadota bacterium]MEC7380062.1 DUF3501 family protein [Pseudomonadota bacterium]
MTLTRNDLWSLEEYAGRREEFRKQVLAHKKLRQVALGPHATLYFEDQLTMQYQIQEMLRVERIFEAAEIEEELSAYNPLIPDGSNWKATFMIEYGDIEERKQALATMGGIEETVWVQVGNGTKAYAIANEDMERTRDSKAAAVHFMRFELSAEDLQSVRDGADVHMGLDHPSIANNVTLSTEARQALCADLAL